jgi:hypothetical protein
VFKFYIVFPPYPPLKKVEPNVDSVGKACQSLLRSLSVAPSELSVAPSELSVATLFAPLFHSEAYEKWIMLA